MPFSHATRRQLHVSSPRFLGPGRGEGQSWTRSRNAHRRRRGAALSDRLVVERARRRFDRRPGGCDPVLELTMLARAARPSPEPALRVSGPAVRAHRPASTAPARPPRSQARHRYTPERAASSCRRRHVPGVRHRPSRSGRTRPRCAEFAHAHAADPGAVVYDRARRGGPTRAASVIADTDGRRHPNRI